VPGTGVINPLSLGRAALAAGLSLCTLNALTEELKRTPRPRARKPCPVLSDPERLSTWLHRRNRQKTHDVSQPASTG
jgi:hypothetical protein